MQGHREETWSLYHIYRHPLPFPFSPPLFPDNPIREKREMEVDVKRQNERHNVRKMKTFVELGEARGISEGVEKMLLTTSKYFWKLSDSQVPILKESSHKGSVV